MPDTFPPRPFHLVRRSFEHDTVRLALLLIVAAFLADWASKSWALQRLAEGTIPLGSLTLGIARNEAFALSIGADRADPSLVLGLRILAIGGIVLLCRHIVYLLDHRNACGFALVLAGGLGNVADLLLRGGGVVDFIGAGPFPLPFAAEPTTLYFVFNTADLFILVGIGLLGPLIHEAGRTGQRRIAAWEAKVLAGAPWRGG